MSVRALKIVDTGYKKITGAVTNYDKATAKDKMALRVKIKHALKDYANDVLIMIHNGDIKEDPFHIIYCKGLKHKFMTYQMIESLYEIRDESDELRDAVDKIMSKAVSLGYMSKWIIMYHDGVRTVVENGYVILFVNGIKKGYAKLSSMINSVMEWIKEMYRKLFSTNSKEQHVVA